MTRSPLVPGEHGYDIRSGDFKQKILTLGSTDFHDVIVGDAQFTDCEFRMKRVAKTDFNFDATCIDCDFHLPKRVANRYMDRPVLESCRFHGHFVGFDFGPKLLDNGILGPSTGSLRNCDFSNARLHLCAFYETSLQMHVWPDWPHIYLDFSQGTAWAHELAESPVPLKLKTVLRLESEESREHARVRSQCIVSVYLPELDEDPEALWPLVQDVPQIWFPGKDTKPRATPDQVLATQKSNNEVAAKLMQEGARLAPFTLLHRCWLLECRPVGSLPGIELIFDSSHLQTRVSDAPARVRLMLEKGRALLRKQTGCEVLNGPVDKFMVMGAALEGQTAILKPHRKERGQVVVDFASCAAFDETGSRLEIPHLQDCVRRYWST